MNSNKQLFKMLDVPEFSPAFSFSPSGSDDMISVETGEGVSIGFSYIIYNFQQHYGKRLLKFF